MRRKSLLTIGMLIITASLVACGNTQETDSAKAGESLAEQIPAEGKTDAVSAVGKENTEQSEENANAGETDGAPKQASVDGTHQDTGLPEESGADSDIDFAALQEKNPDIFAWLYVPGTGIDAPILQSPESDDYYISHTADGNEGDAGALYTEMPNMMNLCDFNTVIHGKDTDEGDLFADLHRFEDPDFFTEHEKFYIYLPDNVLTYEIFAACYDEGSDILRRYDYTTYKGCEEHLKQIYGRRDMSKNLREGWEDLTPAHFLVTLKGELRKDDDRQYVVIGVLTGDAAGTIDRVILD